MSGIIENASYLQNVSRGAYPGHVPEHKFGYAPAVGTAEVTIHSAPTAALISYPAAPITAFLSSSSANDDVAGTGALTVQIWYYATSADTGLTTVVRTLNGQSADAEGISLWRIHRMKVISSGSGNKNAGDVWLGSGTVTAGVPATKYGLIATGDNITQQSFMWVPIGKTLEIHCATFSVNTGKDAKVALFHRLLGADEFYRGDTYEVNATVAPIHFKIPIYHIAGTDLEFRAIATASESFVGANFDVVMRPA